MPSDPRVARALASLANPIAQYRAAVTGTIEEIRGYLEAGRASAQARADRVRRQLGPFAGSRIDAGRLSGFLGDADALGAPAIERLERASDALRTLVTPGDDLFSEVVPPGGDLTRAVSMRLSVIGRAFAAGRIAAAARQGVTSGLDEDVALESFPFAEWNTAERQLAPPVIVTVEGADLNAGALAPCLDGTQKILLIVDGPCPPAALVRLITPGVLVMQAHEPQALDLLGDWPGAAIGALVPPASARFVHDPAAGRESWQRLTVQMDPSAQIARIGGLTAAQQKEELHQLHTLAARPAQEPAVAVAAAPPEAMANPADRLAAWLLQQAGFTAPGTGT